MVMKSNMPETHQPSRNTNPWSPSFRLTRRQLIKSFSTRSEDRPEIKPQHNNEIVEIQRSLSRRDTIQGTLLAAFGCKVAEAGFAQSSEAALVQFPSDSLKNTYYLVRAGLGEAESEGYILTNTVFKTSMSSGLSPAGRRQVVTEVVPKLEELGACTEGCWIWPSICQRSYQSAELIARLMGIGQNRIIPEFSFLDARGLGDYEGLQVDYALPRITEGDTASPDWRPPRGYDGTPNESVNDVMVRVRQVMSITETQYRNTDVIIVAPDSDNLSILQAAIVGLDLRQHQTLGFKPGEVRRLELSLTPADRSNSKFACNNPPKCTL